MDQAPLIDYKCSVGQRCDCRRNLFLTYTGQKTQSSEVNAHYRYILVANQRDRVEQGSIAAQTNQKFYGIIEIGRLPERTDIRRKYKSGSYLFQKRLVDHRLQLLPDQFVKKPLHPALLFVIDYSAVYGYF